LFGNAERNKRGNGSMKEKKRKEKRKEGKKGRRTEKNSIDGCCCL
tara:strand:+ start:436 stop:570 length:135 start_codon:yes stop_codon:yes gene_type:complete